MAAEIEGGPNVTAHVPEGTAIKSTGETGGTKFLREDGDGTSSWQKITFKTTITWPTWATEQSYPHVVGALAFTDSGGEDDSELYDIVQVTHNLGTTDIIVDVIELSIPSGSYYSQQNAGLDIGHSGHVIAVRDGVNAVKLIFYNFNVAGSTYRVLVQKIT